MKREHVDWLSGDLVSVTPDLLEADWLMRGKGRGEAHPPPGFRCHLCGHQFQVGDLFRGILNRKGNALVCGKCDGPDVVQRWEAHVADVRQRAWWLFPVDATPKPEAVQP